MIAPPNPSVLLMVRSLGQGGSERQLTEMAIALNLRGWVIHTASFLPGGIRAADLENSGIPVFALSFHSFLSLAFPIALWRLARYRHAHGLTILHAFDYPSNFVAAAAGRLCGFRRIMTSQRSFRDLRSALWRRLLRWTDRRADAIVVNCNAVRRHLMEDERVPEDRIRLCYNGLAAERYPVRSSDSEGNNIIIGTVCALRPEKGLLHLVEAFAAISDRYRNASLLIVGSGPERNRLEVRATERGIAPRCEWRESVADVSPWLQKIDIFVLPSESEALSNSLLEAMAGACAVVASEVGGTPELVIHEQTGLLFRRGDPAGLAECLEQLLSCPSTRRRLAGAAAAHVRENFSLESAAVTMGNIYKETRADH